MAKTQAPYDDGDGASAVTAYTDADGGIVPAGVAAYVAAGVAVPVDAAHPLPVALPVGAATEETTAAIAEGIGAPDDAAAGTDTGTWSLLALVKRGLQALSTLVSRVPALVGGRVPVDGSGVTQPVSGPLTDAQLRAAGVPVVTVLGPAVTRTIAADATGDDLILLSGLAPAGCNAWLAKVGTPGDNSRTILFYYDVNSNGVPGDWDQCACVMQTATRIGYGGILWGGSEFHQGAYQTVVRMCSDGRPVRLRAASAPGVAVNVSLTPIYDPGLPVQSVRSATGVPFPVQINVGPNNFREHAHYVTVAGFNSLLLVNNLRVVYSVHVTNISNEIRYIRAYQSSTEPNFSAQQPEFIYALPPLYSDFVFNSAIGDGWGGYWITITGRPSTPNSGVDLIGADEVFVNLHYGA